MKNVYLFDFDGTLTTKDSLFDFLQFSQKNYKKGVVKHLPLFIAAKLKLIPKEKAKEKFIAFFLQSKTKEELEEMAQEYFQNRKATLLKKSAVDYIHQLPSESEKYVVSASLDIWLKPFADYLGMHLICTEAEFQNKIYTGKFATANCNYQEKKKRIETAIDLGSYNKIYAFGDTQGDQAMLTLADEKFYRYFH